MHHLENEVVVLRRPNPFLQMAIERSHTIPLESEVIVLERSSPSHEE